VTVTMSKDTYFGARWTRDSTEQPRIHIPSTSKSDGCPQIHRLSHHQTIPV